MKGKYTVFKDKPKEFFDLIPQSGVTHLLCEDDPRHNAIWDMAVSPEGRIFFSVCGESYESLWARLYEFDKETKSFIRHIELEKELLISPHSLRTSKFHTALSFIGDGKILTATHTTSPAPTHPTWMPYEYADHPYESYPGSNLLIYDYEKKECRGLGVISPHDTVYGATYDPKNGDYFAITWMRGTGYVYNVHTGDIRSLGQISDTHTSRTFLLSDGHIYGSTYSGAMFRYNTDIREVEWLGVSAPGLIRHAREYNGVLYFTTGPCSVPGRGQELYAFDIKTREIKVIGRPVPPAEPIEENSSAFYNAYGMAFDSKGRMWYGCMTFVPHHRYVGARLYMWDFLNGKEPLDCGFLGSPKRTLSITAEMHILDDVLYISDGNHSSFEDTPSAIMAIELDKFVPAIETEKRIPSHDFLNYLPYQKEALSWYPKDDLDECLKKYDDYYENTILYFEEFVKTNSARHPFKKASGISLWEKLGAGKAPISDIIWTSEKTLTLRAGEDGRYKIDAVISDSGEAHILEISEEKAYTPHRLLAGAPENLPSVPGRKYLSDAECSIYLSDGSVLAGTHDTMLSHIRDGKVFSLGQVCSAGGVHSLSLSPSGTVYGVAGHKLGVGQIFTFSPDEGVKLLGIVPEAWSECGRNVAIYRPTVISVSPDGKYLAVGGADEIGGAVILKL